MVFTNYSMIQYSTNDLSYLISLYIYIYMVMKLTYLNNLLNIEGSEAIVV